MKRLVIMLSVALGLFGCKTGEVLPTSVGEVNLQRYTGLWFDVASFPARFQKNCFCTTATYTLTDEGTVEVYNSCRKGGAQGKVSGIRGKAFTVKGSNNTKLKVQFFWPFRADYWIVKLDKDYQWAVVSTPGKNYLWILSRTPVMDEMVYNTIVDSLRAEHYDTGLLHRTPQLCK